MKFKQLIFSSLFWRGLYFATVLLLNIVVSRFFGAKDSGWIYYITNYFSFILLIAGCCLETGMIFFASGKRINGNKLAIFSLIWSAVVSVLILVLLSFYYTHPGQEFTRNQFLFFAANYITGVLLTTFFSSLFYARQNYTLPNIIPASSNLVLILYITTANYFNRPQDLAGVFLKLYFFNFLLQGVVVAFAYLKINRSFRQWSLPGAAELKLLFRYSILALFANIIFFLLYRVDYWFVKNTCEICKETDLGNYIQVSKLGQMFLLVPTIIASTIFPHTAAGFKEQVSNWLPVLAKSILAIYACILLFFILVGQWFFPWVYGNTFGNMYIPFLFLIPGIVSLSLIALLAAYNAGKDSVKTNVKGSGIGLIIILAGDWLLIPGYGINAAALISSIGYTAYFIYLLYTFKKEYNIAVKDFFIPGIADWQKLKQLIASYRKNKI
jgi:O-antigen/teichoic acid export membrane protein